MRTKGFFILISIIALTACSSKQKSMKGDEPVEVNEFIEFFPERKLPIQIADSSLSATPNDSFRIAPKVFSGFIPDSIWVKDFGKASKPKFYALSKAREKGKETYLFFQMSTPSKKAGYIAVFSKEGRFICALPLVKTGWERLHTTYGLMDGKFQIITYRDKITDGGLRFKRNVYIYNEAAGEFTLIMTEPNEEIIEQLINPIDTLPARNHWSADYRTDKRNLVSIRDGKKPTEFIFFIHFEKHNGDCTGELKGIARQTAKNLATYQEPGNPCAVEFQFSTTSVTIREKGGCGSYRDIKCFFEGTYPRKKKALEHKRK